MHVSKTFRNRRSTTIWIEAFRTINLWSAIWKTNAFYLFIDIAQNSLNLIFKWKQKNPVILCIYCSYWIMITQINLPSLTPRVLHCLISLPHPRIHTHSGCTYVLASWSTPIEANGVRKFLPFYLDWSSVSSIRISLAHIRHPLPVYFLRYHLIKLLYVFESN